MARAQNAQPFAHAPARTFIVTVVAAAVLWLGATAGSAKVGTEGPAERLVAARQGDTIAKLLERVGIPVAETQELIAAMRKVWDPRELHLGQEFLLKFADSGLAQLRFAPSLQEELVVARNAGGGFSAHVEQRSLLRVPTVVSGTIHSSLVASANAAGVPAGVLTDMIHAFSYDVDFQREVQPGDRFEVLFDRIYDEAGKVVASSTMRYAAMTLSGNALRYYRFQPARGEAGFYNAKGESVKKALLRTPVDGARITSGFGMRVNPILGYSAMHRGVDFGVPPGSPIFASGDATVEVAGPSGGYGNFVLLRHNASYETAYAHMKAFARGIRSGVHVRQGQVIGYVGATGRATGPHLHYEVRVNGAAINPLSVKMASHEKLAGRDLAAFRNAVETLDREALAARHDDIVAVLHGGE